MASGYGGIRVGGPYFDDLSKGQVFDWAPGVTLSLGLAAAHQSIVGNRLRLALDSDLCAAVTGMPGPLAHPGLVCDVAIGQSTLATQRVKANLFYRGLRFTDFRQWATPSTPVPRWWGCEPTRPNRAVRQPDWRGCG